MMELINKVYDAALITGLTIGYSMIAKKLLKMKEPDLGRITFSDSAKLIAIVSASVLTKEYLVARKIIPNHINM